MQEGCSREVGGGVELTGAGEARVEGMGKCLERFVEDWFRDKQMPKADVFRKKWVEIRFERKVGCWQAKKQRILNLHYEAWS